MTSSTRDGPRNWILRNVLDRQAKSYGDKPFRHYLPDDHRYSYCEVRSSAINLEHAWSEQGITQRSHVALFMDNCPEFAC